MTIRKWPFVGDKPVSRARKMALAYRNVAEELAAQVKALRDAADVIAKAVDKSDRRLLAYDSPQTLSELDQALKAVKAALELPPAGDPVKALDERFTSWGETWHCEQPVAYGMDEYVRTSEAARLIHISDKTLSHNRIHGKIKGVFERQSGATGGYWYLVRDVYALGETLPGRSWRRKRPTDTLNASETGDSE